MKISGIGALVGAVTCAAARSAVILFHLGDLAKVQPAFVVPSATIGMLVGAIAGAAGKPVRGAVVGAVLSGVVFEVLMLPCVSLIGLFSPVASEDFFRGTLLYGLQMAGAGAIGGALGGGVGRLRERRATQAPVSKTP